MTTQTLDTLPPPAQEDVLAEWLDPHLPTVFARWHPYVVGLQRATTEAIIAAAEVAPGDAVLDVGCGSGIPALALAAAVDPTGRVTAVDPSPVFVAAVAENARHLGLANLDAFQSSAAALPFPPATFDAATCHTGVMFFPDVRAGLTRIREVLRPGGRAAFVAWGPADQNALFSSFQGAIQSHLPPSPPTSEPPAPAGDEARPTRFATAGSLAAALRDAGFGDVREEARTVDLTWPGPPESLRAFWLDLSRIEDKVPPDRLDALRADLLASFRRYADGDGVRLPAAIVLATGRA